MKRKFSLITLALVAVGVFFWKGTATRWVAPVSPPSKTVPKSLTDLTRAAPGIKGPAAPSPGTGVPVECLPAWGEVLHSDAQTWMRAIADDRATADPKCREWEKAHWQGAFGKFPADACFSPENLRAYLDKKDASPDEVKTSPINACLQLLFFYRSWVIGLATQEMPATSLGATVLANKIFARFKDIADPKAKPDILEWNRRLRELEPDLYATYKLPLLLEALEGMPSTEHVDQFLKDTERFDVVDPEIQEIQLMEHTKKDDFRAFRETLEEFAKQSPQEARWDYYRGYDQWKQGNAAQASQLVTQALAKNPGNRDYQKTLELMKQASPGTPKIFFFSMSFRFDQL